MCRRLRIFVPLVGVAVALSFLVASPGVAGAVQKEELSIQIEGLLGSPVHSNGVTKYVAPLRAVLIGALEGTDSYDVPVWIIAPVSPEDGNGTVIVDSLHSENPEFTVTCIGKILDSEGNFFGQCSIRGLTVGHGTWSGSVDVREGGTFMAQIDLVVICPRCLPR